MVQAATSALYQVQDVNTVQPQVCQNCSALYHDYLTLSDGHYINQERTDQVEKSNNSVEAVIKRVQNHHH